MSRIAYTCVQPAPATPHLDARAADICAWGPFSNVDAAIVVFVTRLIAASAPDRTVEPLERWAARSRCEPPRKPANPVRPPDPATAAAIIDDAVKVYDWYAHTTKGLAAEYEYEHAGRDALHLRSLGATMMRGAHHLSRVYRIEGPPGRRRVTNVRPAVRKLREALTPWLFATLEFGDDNDVLTHLAAQGATLLTASIAAVALSRPATGDPPTPDTVNLQPAGVTRGW